MTAVPLIPGPRQPAGDIVSTSAGTRSVSQKRVRDTLRLAADALFEVEQENGPQAVLQALAARQALAEVAATLPASLAAALETVLRFTDAAAREATS